MEQATRFASVRSSPIQQPLLSQISRAKDLGKTKIYEPQRQEDFLMQLKIATHRSHLYREGSTGVDRISICALVLRHEALGAQTVQATRLKEP